MLERSRVDTLTYNPSWAQPSNCPCQGESDMKQSSSKWTLQPQLVQRTQLRSQHHGAERQDILAMLCSNSWPQNPWHEKIIVLCHLIWGGLLCSNSNKNIFLSGGCAQKTQWFSLSSSICIGIPQASHFPKCTYLHFLFTHACGLQRFPHLWVFIVSAALCM